jgi:WD40 repeat protein
MEAKMIIVRTTLTILTTFILVACSAFPGQAPEAVHTEAPVPKQAPAEPGTLAASIPVAEWRDNSDGHFLFPLDPESGEPLKGYEPIELGQAIVHAFSPDMDTLAVVGFVSSEHPAGGSLHLINLKTWVDRVQELQLDGYVNTIAFSPDGKQLAVAYGNAESQLLILEVSKPYKKSKEAVRQGSLDFLVYKMDFNADGSGLMVYGTQIKNRYTVNETSPDPAIVNLLDSNDLSLRWQAKLPGVRHGVVSKDDRGDDTTDLHQPGQAVYLFPGLVFAPDRDALYVIHPDEDKLTTVDFDAQKVRTVEIKSKLSFFERLLSLTAGVAHAKIAEGTSKQAAVSPDGRFVFVVGQRTDLVEDNNGNWQMIEFPLGLQVVDTRDGSRIVHIDTEANEVSISPDGHYLYLRGWGDSQNDAWTQIFDTSTNQLIARMDGMWLVPTRSAGGAPVLASSLWIDGKGEYRNAIVDSQSVRVEWVSLKYQAWLTTK